MTCDELKDFFVRLVNEAEDEFNRKNADYSLAELGGDPLDNFKEVGRLAGVRARQVCFIYMLKHVLAVRRHAQQGTLTSESIRGRLIDLINYSGLYGALAEEECTEREFAESLYTPDPPEPEQDLLVDTEGEKESPRSRLRDLFNLKSPAPESQSDGAAVGDQLQEAPREKALS